MKIWGIKCKQVFAGPGMYAFVAEAKVVVKEPDELFVMINEYDGFVNCTVAKQSQYAFFAEDGEEPDDEFIEEYKSFKETSNSQFAAVFAILRRNISALKKNY